MTSLLQRPCCFLIGNLGNGGQERQLYYLVSKLASEGTPSHVLVWNDLPGDKYTAMLSHPLIHLHLLSRMSMLGKISYILEVLNYTRPHAIQSFAFYLNFHTFLFSLMSGIPGIGAIRTRLDEIIKATGKPLGWLCAIFPRHKIANNHYYDISCSPFTKLFNRDTLVVSNHLDVASFGVSYPSYSGTLRTASIGSLLPEKRIDLLIDAMVLLAEHGISVIHEHAGDGYLKDTLLAKAKALGIGDRFHFRGAVSDISGFLGDKHLYLHASDYEGCPNAVMEAMASGKGIVTTNCGDVPFLVADNLNGYITPTGSAEAMAEKIKFIAENPLLLKRFGERSRLMAEEKFDLSRLTEKTINIYRTLFVN